MEILTTVISISAVTVALSVLIILAEKYLNDYGDCRIDINGREQLVVKGGDTLLSSLSANGIYIPSACGGRATCGLCRVRITGGGGPVLPTEEPFISEQDRAAGVRLSCQVKVKGDIQIVIPDGFFGIKGYRARVDKIRDLTYDIKEFRLALEDHGNIDFTSGQYVQIDPMAYTKAGGKVSRAYSISSLPSDGSAVELIVRLVPGGICTTYMHKRLKIGDEVALSGPYGDFRIREGTGKCVFIAGGSGLAPIKSMILDLLEKGTDREMILFFGAGSEKDIYYHELFSEIEADHGKFVYVPALSSPESGTWDGETGLITDVVARRLNDVGDVQAYVCGSPGMTDACIRVLNGKGLGEDHIFYDKF